MTSATDAVRGILQSKKVNLSELAEAAKTTRGRLIDFADGNANLSPDQLEAIVRALWHGGVTVKNGYLYVIRSVGLTPVLDGTLLGPYAEEAPA